MKIVTLPGTSSWTRSAPSSSSSSTQVVPVLRDPVDLGAQRAVAVPRDVRDPLQERALVDPARELVVGEEPVLAPVDLARASRARRGRDGDLEPWNALEQALDQRPLARARRPGDDEDGPRRAPPGAVTLALRWLKSSTSSVRWRSESPPTVFDWLIRHWFRSRAAFTRPNFGHGHEHVEDLRRRDELGRIEQDRLDLDDARLQVPLELSAADSDVVRPLQRLHPLVE